MPCICTLLKKENLTGNLLLLMGEPFFCLANMVCDHVREGLLRELYITTLMMTLDSWSVKTSNL